MDGLTSHTKVTFKISLSPKLYYHMVMTCPTGGRCGRDGRAIKVFAQRDASKLKDGRSQVDMCCYGILFVTGGNTRTSNEQRHLDIFFISASFSRRQSVLANVEAIVRCVDNVCVVTLTTLLETPDKRIHQLVNCLKNAQTGPIKVVIVFDDRSVLLRQFPDPVRSAGLRVDL